MLSFCPETQLYGGLDDGGLGGGGRDCGGVYSFFLLSGQIPLL